MIASQTAVMARRNLLHVRSDPQQLIRMTVQPLMFLLLFVYVFGGAISGSTRGYLQFVLPGLLVQGIGFGTTQTAVGLNADFQRGLIDRFRSLPMARSAVVSGRVTADIRFGQQERADLIYAPRQPLPLLLLAAEHRDRLRYPD